MQEASSLREIVKSSWFARLDVLAVILSSGAWMFFPEYVSASPLLLLFLPWILRLLVKEAPFRRTRFDWLILIFLITTWVGYWASYNEASALHKAWLLTASVFLYYALSAQPEENLTLITSTLFMIGVVVSIYFFFTHDFVTHPSKVEVLNQVGVLWFNFRPQAPWQAIHPNYIAGIAAITALFGLYPLQKSSRKIPIRVGILAGFLFVLAALIMTTSRGIWMALGSAAGLWLMWRLINLNGIKFRLGKETLFPILVLVYLCVIVTVLYVGPARFPSSNIGSTDYGVGSRAELFVRSLYFLEDYPITGGGLAAFPGLYSQYILGIPYFYLINSHNLFLDVAIEQGIFGGLAFLSLYVLCIWYVAKAIVPTPSSDGRFFQWLVLIALVVAFVHGLVDDYLYNENGSFLSLLLIGLSSLLIKDDRSRIPRLVLQRRYALGLFVGLVALPGLGFNILRAVWFANLGAVQLAKVELNGFPGNGWRGPAFADQLDEASDSLQSAIGLNPYNRTANHRLGLISAMRQDFLSAATYLEVAHHEAPQHRGINKSLGYSYAWLGETENAVSFLREIPETRDELDSYNIWWKEQGRSDLWANVTQLHQRLDSLLGQQ
jgi:O-antigen ligase